jgi:hypothetical protein
VASRNGRFEVDVERAEQFADRIRQGKRIDPTLGLYAAYAYAQAGAFEDVYSVFTYMRMDPEVPILFDVVMLALRYTPMALAEARANVAPFAPMLSQGWMLLARGDAMFRDLHGLLRPYLVPSLFTTFTSEGVVIARAAVANRDVA